MLLLERFAKGIGYHPEHQVESADPAARTLSFSNGSTADYDLLLYVPPHRAPAVVREAGLTGPSGWISSDPETLRTEADGVYAIGDIAGIPIPSGKSLPKSGVFAHRQAEVVAENLAAEWSGGTPDQVFDGSGACFIETGSGRAGYGAGDFYRNPSPHMKLRSPSRLWHLGKVAFEKSPAGAPTPRAPAQAGPHPSAPFATPPRPPPAAHLQRPTSFPAPLPHSA